MEETIYCSVAIHLTHVTIQVEQASKIVAPVAPVAVIDIGSLCIIPWTCLLTPSRTCSIMKHIVPILGTECTSAFVGSFTLASASKAYDLLPPFSASHVFENRIVNEIIVCFSSDLAITADISLALFRALRRLTP